MNKSKLIFFLLIIAIIANILPTKASADNVIISQITETIVSETEIKEKLQNLPGWTVENKQLRRTYEFKNFVEAINFVNSLVEPAEKAGHHPDLTISYNKVMISLTTHDAGGLTQKDFDLAETISKLLLQ